MDALVHISEYMGGGGGGGGGTVIIAQEGMQ